MDTNQDARLKAIVVGLIQEIGDDPEREGLVDTPARVAEAYREMFEGYRYTTPELTDMLKTFNATSEKRGNRWLHPRGKEDIVWIRDIPFQSTCEHHLLPFMGKVTVAYIPKNGVIGLSKVPRVVRILAHKLQIQERLGREIRDLIMAKAKGVAVYVESSHLCLTSRGERARETTMETVSYGGLFEDDRLARRFEQRL